MLHEFSYICYMKEWEIVDEHLKKKGWGFQDEKTTRTGETSILQYTKMNEDPQYVMNMNVYVNEKDQVTLMSGASFGTFNREYILKFFNKQFRKAKLESILQ